MKKNIFNIIMMLLTLSAAFSCDALVMDQQTDKLKGDGKLMISGTVSDSQTASPLEGIRISFSAFEKSAENGLPLMEMNVYTDNHGTYTIEAEGFSEDLTCLVTATDTEGAYKGAVQEVTVTWGGVSFDMSNDTFIVNDCDFKLEKK